jgi:hypothetical protein
MKTLLAICIGLMMLFVLANSGAALNLGMHMGNSHGPGLSVPGIPSLGGLGDYYIVKGDHYIVKGDYYIVKGDYYIVKGF